MRTAISESGRAVLEARIRTWVTLEEGKLEQLHLIALQLSISEEAALDMLNECANSRAALDRFGIEVYADESQVPAIAPDADCDDFAMEKLDRYCFALVCVLCVLCAIAWFNPA